jgi:2,4-dienoyl-CoA reductase-like NADH-dependent reductase (Old Yellow Enzyme family)
MRKIIFTTPFYHACGAQPLCQLLHRGSIKWEVALAQPTSSHTLSNRSSASFPTAEKKEKIEKQIEKIRGSC